MHKLIQANERRQGLAQQVRQWSIDDFHATLRDHGIYRAYIVYENGQFQLSHPAILEPLQAFLELSQDFGNHEGLFIGREDGLDSLFCAFVHDTRRGLAQGGLRFSGYTNIAELLVDGMRLSQGMTRKNALASLSWGGGKGIMTLPSRFGHPREFVAGPERQAYFEAYGRFVASLGGIYYTAEDVGTNTQDMAAILSHNRFTTCIPASFGGSGNPSPYTARGVLRAMQAAWQALTGSDSLQGVRVAVQGTGNVGGPLIRYLDDLGAEVIVSDVNQTSLQEMLAERPRLTSVSPEAIFDVDADVFAPCAIGAQVNVDTIPRLKVKLVCGAANNILRESEADAARLKARGIAYVPDFVCNRMGIVNCANEWQGYLSEDARQAAERVFPDTLRVFKYAHSRNTTTAQAANDLADMAASEVHNEMGHRGRRIIDHLIQSGWSEFKPGQTPEIADQTSEPVFVPALDEKPLRVQWEREGYFHGRGYTLAATPISTASSPDLGGFLSPLLLDVRARALEELTGERPRRVLGSEHGGLALQIAVEQSLPYTREEVGRPEFVSRSRDLYLHHDEAVRDQLHQMGVGFEHLNWINPMQGSRRRAVEQVYLFLQRAGLIYRQDALAHYSPSLNTVLVSSDVGRRNEEIDTRYHLSLPLSGGNSLPVTLVFPEYLPAAIALAVPEGHPAIGQTVSLFDQELPVCATGLVEEPELVIPLSHKRHEKIARDLHIHTRIQLFDEQGLMVPEPVAGLSREQARQQLVNALGELITPEQGRWTIETYYCRRSGSTVVPRYSEQMFVRIEEAVSDLLRRVDSGEITFSAPQWREQMHKILSELNVWCISRQYWWGNEIPDSDSGEVFSTWFSLAVWALQGAGWPNNPKPQPIDEVIVDADLLFRWIVPAQLLAVLITGRPVFKHIQVHGTLHVIERALQEHPDAPLNAPDEARFLYQSVHRPMRYRLGNTIEPGTLIRRFGADSLRLGYLLSLEAHSEAVTILSESRLRQARRTIQRLTGKVSGALKALRGAESGPATPLDHWIVTRAEQLHDEILEHYRTQRYTPAALLLVEGVEALVQYINLAIQRRNQGNLGAFGPALIDALTRLESACHPICPFVFTKLGHTARQQLEGEVPDWDILQGEMVEQLRLHESPDSHPQAALLQDGEIAALCGLR